MEALERLYQKFIIQGSSMAPPFDAIIIETTGLVRYHQSSRLVMHEFSSKFLSYLSSISLVYSFFSAFLSFIFRNYHDQ